MGTYGGYICDIDEPERAQLLRGLVELPRVGDDDTTEPPLDKYGESMTPFSIPRVFTEAMSLAGGDLKDTEICLISFDHQKLNYAALVRRGIRVVTAQYRVQFSHFVPLNGISIDDLQLPVAEALASYLPESRKGVGKRMPSTLWTSLLAAIKQQRPERTEALDALESLRLAARMPWTGESFEVMAQEKDAVGLALSIFDSNGLQRKNLATQSPPDSSPAPFLRNIGSATLIEDQMVAHDAQVFGDWQLIKSYVVGAAEFFKRGERLTVMNVNRHPIERTLGVDLIYYHHHYQSYVLVQYKRLVKGNTSGQWGYRPDRQFRAELKRMRQFEATHGRPPKAAAVGEYRLNPGTFYFKFCRSVIYQPLSTDLIQGMYIPMRYWSLLAKSPTLQGRQRGIRITYDNVGRHIDNTQFIDLVQHGWIGSRSLTSHAIGPLIEQLLAGSNSVILAASGSS